MIANFFQFDPAIPVLENGVMCQLGIDVVYFLFVCHILLWPTEAIRRFGFTFENLPRIRLFDFTVVGCLEMKTGFNRIYASMLPFAFSIYLNLTYDPLPLLIIFLGLSHINFQYQMFSLLAITYNLLNGKARYANEFNSDEHTMINNFFFYNPGHYAQFTEAFAYGNHFNDRFCIRVRRFGYSIHRLADYKFAVIASPFSVFGLNSFKRDEGFHSIRGEHRTNGSFFTFQMLEGHLRRFSKFNEVEMKCSSIQDRFAQSFISYIHGNSTFAMKRTASLAPCKECNEKQSNVIIRKNCIDDSWCGQCRCRPVWCAACLARIFADVQPADKSSEWMDGTARCPTCRTPFCANDVLLIQDESDR